MKPRAWLILLALPLIGVTLVANPPSRMLMYTYPSEGIIVTISFIDLPSGPVCHIDDGRISSALFKIRDFPLSKEEFERIWSVTPKLAPFEHKKDSSAERDGLNYYVFATAEMPKGEKRTFVIPKDRAPKSVIEVVREIRAYNRD
jgi:hypothetical protein